MKLAHISDLHFVKPSWNPFQFFSKRWLGNLNLLFSRKNDFLPERLAPLPSLFRELGINHVIISGDVSTTSHKKEFEEAAKFVEKIEGMEVFTIPGNHDHYTRSSYRKKTFYNYFPGSLRDSGVAAKQIDSNWWIVTLDTALATSLISSRGKFSLELEAKLKEQLSFIPSHHNIILVNHFSFFQNDTPRRTLERGKELQALIQNYPNVKLYLHGHSHRHCIADLRPNNLPIILDSGSTPHRTLGSWNLIDISSKGCSIDVFVWKEGWQKDRRVELTW